MDLEDDDPPESTAVGNSWGEFERVMLPSVAEELRPTTLGVSQLSFYFGALAMLNIVQVPPHVEYRLTLLGQRFESVLEQIRSLEQAL
jgi:hypothetical protein